MEPPSFSTTGPHIIRAAPGSDASLVLPLPSGSPPFQFEWSRAGAKLDDRFKRSEDSGGVRLTISAARTGDSGVYTLQASNAAGKDTTRVRLEVSPDEMPTGDDPPNFLRRLQDLTVKVGTRTRFLVEIVSSTECRVTWYRNERRLLEAERIALVRDGNFWCADISAVSVDDAGRWTCTAENVGGRASCSAHLNVLVPKAYKRPEFVEELRALLTEQGTVSLECKVVGVPTPVLRWFKDSREIKAGDVFALTANAEDPTSLGTYTCEAINCMGRAYSSSKVHVVGRASREDSSRPSSGGFTPEPPPIFTKELEDQLARICEPITLSCNIVVPPWPRSVVWYNKEGKIEPSEKYHVLEDGVGGYLLEVPSAEWPDEGEWKCVATSTGGRVGISTCYVSMDVPKNYRKPRFMENLQAVLTEEGLVSFECKVVGFPTPVLSWFKDGQELKPGDVYQLTGTNSLGSYCCIARNCMGQASSSAELTVEDIQNQLNEEEKLQLFSKNQAPKFLQGLKSAEAKIDDPFRFTIRVSIPPEPVVSWYRDDQPVDESSRCHHGKDDRGVFFLDVQNLEFMDQAEWKCVAMNDFGQSVTSCFLKLLIPRHYKKPRFLENLQAILSDEGAVNLECKVIGVPQPVLKWYKDGEELKPGDIHRIISGQDGTCCLGTYTCEAQNCMGIAASSASLLGFEDSMKSKNKKKIDEQALQRNLSLSTIHEERTSQMYDTPVGDITLDEKGEISFSFDGKEVSVSLYETPDLTEEEALQIVEMYADQLSENVTEHNVVELPPLRFVKETSTSGNLLMEAIIIDVSPEYFTSPEEDLRTEADIEDISIADENGPPQLSLDIEADGEDYLEKTIALLSDEKIEFPKKSDRKKSDSQKSVDDYFSLSRDQSFSDEKKDDDTQILSESDIQSFASARSSGKPKSQSSKPSIEDGPEYSEVTKTVLLKEDFQNVPLESDLTVNKNKQQSHGSRSSQRSSPGSEKSINKPKEDCLEHKKESENILQNIVIDKNNISTIMNNTSSTLTEVINEIQILERDVILKSEFMSTTATASSSLEIINSLIMPLSEIHSIIDAIRESFDETPENITPLLNKLPQSLNNLQQSITIMCKCIDVESEKKTLVEKTSMSIIQKCGDQLQNIIKDISTAVPNECLLVDKTMYSNIGTISMELINLLNNSIDIVRSEESRTIEKDADAQEDTLESKHLHSTQKAIHELRASLKSLLFIIEEENISKISSFVNVNNSEIILNSMSTPIQDLQNALEQIETLSVAETKTNLQKYNTEIIEKAMESVLKLRTSFEELSAEASSIEDDNTLSEVLNGIIFNIKDISITLDGMETKIGKIDILNSDNKLYALQKMAQILINLENNLPSLKNLPDIKAHMSEFHKNLTKVLENVIESNDASKYLSLLEICDAVNRVNTLIKSIDSSNILSLASICNTLAIIKINFIHNVFQPELNHSIISNIANVIISVQETINKSEELKLNDNLEEVESLSVENYEAKNVKVALENIEKTIISITDVISHETTMDISLKITMENICPVLEDLKYCIASINVNETDKHEKMSDIESLSFTQSIANPLTELHQTINVLNQVICENIECQERKQLVEQYSKPLIELRNTLEILQHDIVSQYIENSTHLDISSSIANVVESLQSCLVMIQEQNVIDPVDDMSTFEDISGIKTIADIIIPSDDLHVAVVEMPIIQSADHRNQIMQSDSIKTLQILNEHINQNLQNLELLSTLDTDANREYSAAKSIIVKLEETHTQINSILDQICMETCQDIVPIKQLEQVIIPLQEIKRQLSAIDISNIPIYENNFEDTSKNNNSLKENLSEFKTHLNECLDVLLPALATTDDAIDISIKIKDLRETCKKINLEAMSSGTEINSDIHDLSEMVKTFLESSASCENSSQVKCAVENLYETIVDVKKEITQHKKKEPDLLTRDFLKVINDIESGIISLEQNNFVNLSQLNISKQKELKEQADNCINDEEILKIYLRECLEPIEIIYNEILNFNQKVTLVSMAIKEKDSVETQMKLKQTESQLRNLNKNIIKLKQSLNINNIENYDIISLAMKLDTNINYILKHINSMELGKMTETFINLRQPIEVVEELLHRILSSGKVYVEEQKSLTDINSNIDTLENALDSFLSIHSDILILGEKNTDINLQKCLPLAFEIKKAFVPYHKDITRDVEKKIGEKIKNLKKILVTIDLLEAEKYLEAMNVLEVEKLRRVFLTTYQLLVKLNEVDTYIFESEVKTSEEKTEALLQHMEHYIEVIEIVEEVSAIIKLDDLKESANIVRELKQSIVSKELITENTKESSLDTKINKEQAEIAYRLQKALISLQNQALENPQELISITNEDIRQQIIEVVSDLQSDLMALTGTNVNLEDKLELLAPLILEDNSQNIQDGECKELVEKAPTDIDHSKEENNIILETLSTIQTKSDDLNQLLSTQVVAGVQLETSIQFKEENIKNQDLEQKSSECDKNLVINDSLKISELAPKLEEVAVINDELIENLMEYISENTMAVNAKLSNPLHCDHLDKTIQIAKQLLTMTVNKTSEQPELLNFSTEQIELVLNLNEAILIMYDTTFEESQELDIKVGKDEMQRFKNIASNLRNILQSVIDTFEASAPFNQVKQHKAEELNIEDSGKNILGEAKSISISNNKMIEGKCKTIDGNTLAKLTENVNKVDSLRTEDVSDKPLVKIVTNKQITAKAPSSEPIIKDNIMTELAVKVTKKEPSIKDELIKHIGNFICEDTEQLQEILPLSFDSKSYNESLKMAHQLYDIFLTEEAENFVLSKVELKLAMLLNKSVSSLYESTVYEDQDVNVKFENSQLMRASNVMKDLCTTLHSLIESTLTQTNLGILELDDLKVVVSQEPFKYELIISENISDFEFLKKGTDSEQAPSRDLKLAALNETEKSDDLSINNMSPLKTQEKSMCEELDDNKSTIKTKNVEGLFCSSDVQEDLLTSGLKDVENPIYELEKLVNEVCEKIDIPCDENLEAIQNTLDEVQTVIMKLKSDFDGSISDACNETLEDLECNVRSVQLQIKEHSPPHILKEACSNLQVLVAFIKDKSDVVKIFKHATQIIANNMISKCSKDVTQTIHLIEKITCSKNTHQLDNIVSNLNKIKNTMKSLKQDFFADKDNLIMGGVDLMHSLEQVEEKIFSIEKDLELVQKIDPMTRDSIISAIHSVYESISNMRGTVSSVQKRYLNENYGEPARSFLQSIRNVMIISENDQNSSWKQFAKSLRKILNHFEDVKFYINFDKTARLPSEAAFTKIILGELYAVLSADIQKSVTDLDIMVTEHVCNSMKCINKMLNDLEQRTTLEVREKIPIFNDLSKRMLELTGLIKIHIEKNVENNSIRKELDGSGFINISDFKEEILEKEVEKEDDGIDYVQVTNKNEDESSGTKKISGVLDLLNTKEPLKELSEKEFESSELKNEASHSDLIIAMEHSMGHENIVTVEIAKEYNELNPINEIESSSIRDEVVSSIIEFKDSIVTTENNAPNDIIVVKPESVHDVKILEKELKNSANETKEYQSDLIKVIKPSSLEGKEISEPGFESSRNDEDYSVLQTITGQTSLHGEEISETEATEIEKEESRLDSTNVTEPTSLIHVVEIPKTEIESSRIKSETVSSDLINVIDVTLFHSDDIRVKEVENTVVIKEEDHLSSIKVTDQESVQERLIFENEAKTPQSTKKEANVELVDGIETNINEADLFVTGAKSSNVETTKTTIEEVNIESVSEKELNIYESEILEKEDKSSEIKKESVDSDFIREEESSLVQKNEIPAKEIEKSQTKEEKNQPEEKERTDFVVEKESTSGYVAELLKTRIDSSEIKNECIGSKSTDEIMTVLVQEDVVSKEELECNEIKREVIETSPVHDEAISEKEVESSKVKRVTLGLNATNEIETAKVHREEHPIKVVEITGIRKQEDHQDLINESKPGFIYGSETLNKEEELILQQSSNVEVSNIEFEEMLKKHNEGLKVETGVLKKDEIVTEISKQESENNIDLNLQSKNKDDKELLFCLNTKSEVENKVISGIAIDAEIKIEETKIKQNVDKDNRDVLKLCKTFGEIQESKQIENVNNVLMLPQNTDIAINDKSEFENTINSNNNNIGHFKNQIKKLDNIDQIEELNETDNKEKQNYLGSDIKELVESNSDVEVQPTMESQETEQQYSDAALVIVPNKEESMNLNLINEKYQIPESKDKTDILFKSNIKDNVQENLLQLQTVDIQNYDDKKEIKKGIQIDLKNLEVTDELADKNFREKDEITADEPKKVSEKLSDIEIRNKVHIVSKELPEKIQIQPDNVENETSICKAQVLEKIQDSSINIPPQTDEKVVEKKQILCNNDDDDISKKIKVISPKEMSEEHKVIAKDDKKNEFLPRNEIEPNNKVSSSSMSEDNYIKVKVEEDEGKKLEIIQSEFPDEKFTEKSKNEIESCHEKEVTEIITEDIKTNKRNDKKKNKPKQKDPSLNKEGKQFSEKIVENKITISDKDKIDEKFFTDVKWKFNLETITCIEEMDEETTLLAPPIETKEKATIKVEEELLKISAIKQDKIESHTFNLLEETKNNIIEDKDVKEDHVKAVIVKAIDNITDDKCNSLLIEECKELNLEVNNQNEIISTNNQNFSASQQQPDTSKLSKVPGEEQEIILNIKQQQDNSKQQMVEQTAIEHESKLGFLEKETTNSNLSNIKEVQEESKAQSETKGQIYEENNASLIELDSNNKDFLTEGEMRETPLNLSLEESKDREQKEGKQILKKDETEMKKNDEDKESNKKQQKEKNVVKSSRKKSKKEVVGIEKTKSQELQNKELERDIEIEKSVVLMDQEGQKAVQTEDTKKVLSNKDEETKKNNNENQDYESGTKLFYNIEHIEEHVLSNQGKNYKLEIDAKHGHLRSAKEKQLLTDEDNKLDETSQSRSFLKSKVVDDNEKKVDIQLASKKKVHNRELEENVLINKNYNMGSCEDVYISNIINDQIQINENIKRRPLVIDYNLSDCTSEFSKPPGYIAKTFDDSSAPQLLETSNKNRTIYKSQTLLYEAQLKSSLPLHSDANEGRYQIYNRTKEISECRSTLSEKCTSVARNLKRKPVFTTYLTDRTAVESSRVKLTCSILSSTNTTVTWYKNGIVLDNKHKFRTKSVDGLITLEIFNAVPSDSGEYSCTIENENGSITTSATLKVYPSFEASPIPPTFTRSIRDNYHIAENELVLECRIRGQPLPSITWFKDGQTITLNDHYQAHYLADGVCRLTINSPSAEDSGKYVCKAENSVWSDQISHDVYFTGKEGHLSPNIATLEKVHFNRLAQEARRPHFTNVLSDHKVVTGGTIGLQVEIKGSPTRVEWLREGHSITDIYRNAQTYVDHGIYTLALSNVTEKESGLYTCRAYSSQGNVDMNTSITVVQSSQYEGKPASIVSRPEKDLIIPVGEDLNVTFRVQGEPKPKVFFMKGIRDITNSQRVCKMTSDDYVKFTLKRTVVSDAGTYCIFARNAYGCDRAFVTVVIRQRASSESLISDWTYTMDDLAISSVDRNYKSVPDRIPSEPSAVDGGNNWVSLAWPKPDSQERAPILAYKVESWLLGKEGGARWIELGITPRNSFDVFNLKQGEEYHFRVTPRNRYGWGESIQTSVPIGIGLAGDRPEFIEILPGQLKILVGETAIFSCSFKGKPTPEIIWMKNGHEIEEEADKIKIELNSFNTYLRIDRVTIEDEGRYSCEATNIHGRSSTYARMAVITDRQIWEADAKLKRERSAGIDAEYPPQFTMRLRDRRVQTTYPVRLTCQVVGNPTPVIKWFKNGEEVVIDGRHTASQDEYFYTLEIAPTKLEDGGVYEAMARNGCGAVSCRCSLVVDKGIRAYIAPEFCCGLEPLYRLSEGEELRISAIVEAYPSVGVTWYRDGVRLRPSRKTIMTLDRDGQIELALASVTGRDCGVYTCTASNEVGRASTSGKVEIVSGEHAIQKTSAPPILISSDVPYSKEPMFIKKPRSSEAREGDTVIIECEVIGDPKPDVYWLRDFLKPDYYRDSSYFKRVGAGPAYRFEIPHAKLDYTGAYSIVAKNVHGETKAIISLQILAKDLTCGDVHNIRFGRVEIIPRFDKELTDLLCYDGDAIEFECRVSGNPEPDIRWFHYNEIVPECADFETSYDEGTARLKIKQVTAEDEGSYTCEASNCLGKATSSSCLVVYPPGEPNTLSQRLRRPPAFLSAASTPRSTPRTTPARSLSRTPGPESARRLCSPSREIAPKFYTYPYNRVAEEGDTIIFQCAVKGLPPPWATWDKDGIMITPSARISIKEKDEMFRILEIEQVTIEDVGLYRISLENDYGRAEASARLEVITQKGKFYGSTRSYSVSPRKTLSYRRRTPSFSKD